MTVCFGWLVAAAEWCVVVVVRSGASDLWNTVGVRSHCDGSSTCRGVVDKANNTSMRQSHTSQPLVVLNYHLSLARHITRRLVSMVDTNGPARRVVPLQTPTFVQAVLYDTVLESSPGDSN